MPKIDQFVCDCGCGAVRQLSNHWRMLRIKEKEWIICEWNEKMQNKPNVKYLAGQGCAHKMLDKFLSIPKPQLSREGTAPAAKDLEAVIAEVEESLSDRIDSLETKPGEPEEKGASWQPEKQSILE